VSESGLKLARAPIVEAVLDIDCDLPPGQEIAKLEASAKKRFSDRYPTVRTVFIQQHEIQAKPDSEAKMLIRRGIQAFQFMQKDEKQLVQVRAQGFSFNRLAPYSSLDDYLSEIERTWRLYLTLSSPVQARVVRLRYINRMMLPAAQGRLELNDYLKISPRLPEEDKLTFLGFLNQYAAEDAATGNQANIVMAAAAVAGAIAIFRWEAAADMGARTRRGSGGVLDCHRDSKGNAILPGVRGGRA